MSPYLLGFTARLPSPTLRCRSLQLVDRPRPFAGLGRVLPVVGPQRRLCAALQTKDK